MAWVRPKNRTIVLFYANGLANQLKAKLNFQRAAAIATVRGVKMNWAMVDCLSVESWICTKLGFSGFPPARLVVANESSWNTTEWPQKEDAVAKLVGISHVVSGDSYYQAYQEVIWGGGPSSIIHAIGRLLGEEHAGSTKGTLVSMMSQRCPHCANFYRDQLLPLGKKEEFADVKFIINGCDNPVGGKFCTEHKTTNYPNVKFFRADEDVYNPDHGTTATARDLLNIEGFVKRLSTAHSEL